MIMPCYEKDKNKTIRKWFIGDAGKQIAEKTVQTGEEVFPIERYTYGLSRVKIEFGWGVGKILK